MDRQEERLFRMAWARIVAKAWRDDDFRGRLFEAGGVHTAFRLEGFAIPESLTINILQNEPGVVHLVIPQRPEIEADGEDLAHLMWVMCSRGVMCSDICSDTD